MHRRRIYHADLKPNNILVGRGGVVKVIDYGLAWVHGEEKDRLQGTPEYMAPEQVKSKVVNEQTDIYNLGATMYRMVTFQLPPACTPGAETAGLPINSKTFQNMFKPVQEIVPGVPGGLCDLIHQCLEYRPAKRPASMAEVHDTLERLAGALKRSPEQDLEALDW
jgi:serine/threonine protein kinase